VLASAPVFPKLLSKGAAMYYELRKAGTGALDTRRRRGKCPRPLVGRRCAAAALHNLQTLPIVRNPSGGWRLVENAAMIEPSSSRQTVLRDRPAFSRLNG